MANVRVSQLQEDKAQEEKTDYSWSPYSNSKKSASLKNSHTVESTPLNPEEEIDQKR